MNLLENYIKEIHSIAPYTVDWTKEFSDRQFVEVNLTSVCYGRIETRSHVWTTDEWEKIKEQGYYWA
jgi:hypothetical protein